MATEEVIEVYTAKVQGNLDALVSNKHGGRACFAHTVRIGDTIEVVKIHNHPNERESSKKLRIIRNCPQDGEVPVVEAYYQPARLRDLTRMAESLT